MMARRRLLFTLMGGLAAAAAMQLTLENKNFFGNQWQGYLLTAIASVLIGGTSIFGGRATIIGTVFGCFIIGMIEAGLVATGLTGAWGRMIQGLVFLISIIFYLWVEEPHASAPSSPATRRSSPGPRSSLPRNSTGQVRPDRCSRLPPSGAGFETATSRRKP
jgi:hypothetical protein